MNQCLEFPSSLKAVARWKSVFLNPICFSSSSIWPHLVSLNLNNFRLTANHHLRKLGFLAYWDGMQMETLSDRCMIWKAFRSLSRPAVMTLAPIAVLISKMHWYWTFYQLRMIFPVCAKNLLLGVQIHHLVNFNALIPWKKIQIKNFHASAPLDINGIMKFLNVGSYAKE